MSAASVRRWTTRLLAASPRSAFSPAQPSVAGGALRSAQLALVGRARAALAGFGLVATSVLATGAWTPRSAPVLEASVPVFCLLFAIPLITRRPPFWPAVAWAAVTGAAWLTVVLLLLGRLPPGELGAIIVASSVLLASLVFAAPAFSVALALAVPAAASVVLADVSLPHSRAVQIVLAFPLTTLASLFFANRLLAGYLRERLLDRERRLEADRRAEQLERIADGLLWSSDADGRMTRLTGELARRIGIPPRLLGDVRLCDLPDRKRDDAGVTEQLAQAVERREAFQDLLLPVGFAGHALWLLVSGHPVTDGGGGFAGYQGLGIDVTRARENERRMADLALNDTLTGLPNRTSFDRRLEQACLTGGPRARGDRAAGQISLMCVSLGDFAAINNTLGAQAGDQLLVAFARRLRGAVRAADFVARLGGGEFGVLVEGMQRDSVAELAGRIAAEAGAPYHLVDFDAEVASGISVGISTAPDDGDDALGLQRNASLALASARKDGLDRPRFFEPEMLAELQEQRALQSDLRQALARGELSVCYQPVVDLGSGAVVSAEALLRWQHSSRGDIPPGRFIPLAEASGMIVALGRFALGEACRDAAAWPAHVRVAVNVSAAQFRDEALLASIDGALAQCGLPASRLDLEITESVLLDASRSTLQLLGALRARGIRIALDDFGTGYSSLRYLRSFPFDKVKIDASFVRDMIADREAAAIVGAIVGLAGKFDIRATAEGVETRAQRDALRAIGCNEGQGFLFGRALDSQAMAERLARQP